MKTLDIFHTWFIIYVISTIQFWAHFIFVSQKKNTVLKGAFPPLSPILMNMEIDVQHKQAGTHHSNVAFSDDQQRAAHNCQLWQSEPVWRIKRPFTASLESNLASIPKYLMYFSIAGPKLEFN